MPNNDPAFKAVEEVLDAVKDVVEDILPYVVAPKQAFAVTTVDSYRQAALAAAITVPFLVMPGGPPTISQPPARQLDDHLASQSQHGEATLEAGAFELSALTTGDSVQLTGVSRASGGRLIGHIDVKGADASRRQSPMD